MKRCPLVLVIDDAQPWRDVLSDILGGTGLEFDVATGVDDAEDLLIRTQYDVVLSDTVVEEELGFKSVLNWYTRLRKRCPKSMLVAVTGKNFTESQRTTLTRSVVDHYVDKREFKADDLSRLVLEGLQRRQRTKDIALTRFGFGLAPYESAVPALVGGGVCCAAVFSLLSLGPLWMGFVVGTVAMVTLTALAHAYS